jgi:hypothetical protein
MRSPYEIRLMQFKSNADDPEDAELYQSEIISLDLDEDDAAWELERLGLSSDKPIAIEIVIAYAIAPHIRDIHVGDFDKYGWVGVWSDPDRHGDIYQDNVVDNNRATKKIRGITFRAPIPKLAMKMANLIARADWVVGAKKELIDLIEYFGGRPKSSKA